MQDRAGGDRRAGDLEKQPQQQRPTRWPGHRGVFPVEGVPVPGGPALGRAVVDREVAHRPGQEDRDPDAADQQIRQRDRARGRPWTAPVREQRSTDPTSYRPVLSRGVAGSAGFLVSDSRRRHRQPDRSSRVFSTSRSHARRLSNASLAFRIAFWSPLACAFSRRVSRSWIEERS